VSSRFAPENAPEYAELDKLFLEPLRHIRSGVSRGYSRTPVAEARQLGAESADDPD